MRGEDAMQQRNRWTMPRALVLAVFLCLAAAPASAGYELPVSGEALVSLVEGSAVQVGAEGELSLSKGERLVAPATVRVGAGSRLELILPEGSVLRFDSQTDFTLVSSRAASQNRQVEVDVAMGDCWASVKDFLGEGDFEVNSPTAVAGVAGTKYRLNVGSNDVSTYRVYAGKVRVGPRWTPQAQAGPRRKVSGPSRVEGPRRVSVKEWTEIVGAGYQFVIRPDGRYDDPKAFDPEKDKADPFVRWNMERDKALDI